MRVQLVPYPRPLTLLAPTQGGAVVLSDTAAGLLLAVPEAAAALEAAGLGLLHLGRVELQDSLRQVELFQVRVGEVRVRVRVPVVVCGCVLCACGSVSARAGPHADARARAHAVAGVCAGVEGRQKTSAPLGLYLPTETQRCVCAHFKPKPKPTMPHTHTHTHTHPLCSTRNAFPVLFNTHVPAAPQRGAGTAAAAATSGAACAAAAAAGRAGGACGLRGAGAVAHCGAGPVASY